MLLTDCTGLSQTHLVAKKPVQAGRPTKTVAENLRRLRELKGDSVRGLAARTALRDGGIALAPNAISEIENGLRRVDVDDLMSLSIALDVSPSTLLMPAAGDSNDPVRVDTDDAMSAGEVWDWITAAAALRSAWVGTDDDPVLDRQARSLWWQRTLPKFARKGTP